MYSAFLGCLRPESYASENSAERTGHKSTIEFSRNTSKPSGSFGFDLVILLIYVQSRSDSFVSASVACAYKHAIILNILSNLLIETDLQLYSYKRNCKNAVSTLRKLTE